LAKVMVLSLPWENVAFISSTHSAAVVVETPCSAADLVREFSAVEQFLITSGAWILFSE
jgi:hypothetical protein